MLAPTHSRRFATAVLLAAGAAAVAGVTGAIIGPGFGSAPLRVGAISSAPIGATSNPIPALQSAGLWLSGVPGGPQALRGRVVVVNFWTYSCINSLRALPYLRTWNERYGSKGLTVVGVHAPEFQFEHDPAKVRLAARQLGVSYPNLQDNNYAVWQQFSNEGWPGFYFIDAQGRMRGYRVGEGKYAEAEQFIRELLTEAGQDLSTVETAPIIGTGIEAEADWAHLRSPESYVSYGKGEGFSSPGGFSPDASRDYGPASELMLNRWDLSGSWTVGREFTTLDQSGGSIRFRFQARDMHLVLGGAADGEPIRFRVTIDGSAPGNDHGADVDADGWGAVKEDRLYQLVRQSDEIVDRTVTIEFARPEVRAYAFTFG
ncbi:redoxin family protein [Bosea sp. (in: a-proteobacteria)]|jgi:thiol-disulfide isomerase/thioredoxin|uniref:redoxin family protein n=1 Tax=Bosea sp. (in: a-proteobacteria) TaxID=1871050 RepID=UPI002DDD1123|nr:redoxin family protein [Bosea sp. (in: a-proteobacteria)]HEV2511624.1 redoxin family protein [Bosea sp. (in: a-proteobacteria)]